MSQLISLCAIDLTPAPDADDGFVCGLTFRHSLTIRTGSTRERVVESDLHIYSNSHHFLTGNYYSISSLLACVYMSELLGMGTGGSKCVMSTEFNGEPLQVFSKSFVFAQLLFVDHSQRTAELLRPVTRAGPDIVELVNCTLIQTSR